MTTDIPDTTPASPAPSSSPAPAWHESLITRDASGAETLADFASWKDRAPAPLVKFITANMTAARARTEGMIRVPGPEAAPEDWDPVYKALGRPDKPEGYGLGAPESLPDGVTWDDHTAGEFATLAHRLGLSPAQVRGLQDFQVGHVGTQAAAAREAMQRHIENEQAALKSTFGERLPDVAAAAQRMARDHGLPPAIFDPVSGDFWGADALRLVSTMAEKLTRYGAEDRGGGGGGSPATGGYTYARAVSTDPAHPDYEAYRRGDPGIVARVNHGWSQMPKTPGGF